MSKFLKAGAVVALISILSGCVVAPHHHRGGHHGGGHHHHHRGW